MDFWPKGEKNRRSTRNASHPRVSPHRFNFYYAEEIADAFAITQQTYIYNVLSDWHKFALQPRPNDIFELGAQYPLLPFFFPNFSIGRY
jgi:hypothetical protein